MDFYNVTIGSEMQNISSLHLMICWCCSHTPRHGKWLVMLGLHRIPRDLRLTYDQKMAKLAVIRELVDKVVCSSHVTHQKVISYSWMLAITRTYLPLKSTSPTIAFNNSKTVLQLANFTCEWPNSQLDTPFATSHCRLLVVHPVASYVVRHGHINRSQVTLDILISCKLLPSDTGNLRRSRQGRMSVVNRSQSITGHSEVGRKCVAAVGPWS